MSEGNVQRDIQITASKEGAVTFRNNVALAWVGKAQKIAETMSIRVHPGDVVIRGARPLHAGLIKGSSDLIGWKSTIITPEMVGEKFARFLAVEVKLTTDLTPEQRNFIEQVNRAGGLAGVAYSADDARALLRG